MGINIGTIMEFLSLLVAFFYCKWLKETFYVYAIPFLFLFCIPE
jgi:hypothetical protein